MNLSANEKTTLFLPAGQVLSVVAASGASGSAIRMAKLPGGGDAQSITAITTGATFTFGPYAETERFEIICTAGTLTITTEPWDPAEALASKANKVPASQNPEGFFAELDADGDLVKSTKKPGDIT